MTKTQGFTEVEQLIDDHKQRIMKETQYRKAFDEKFNGELDENRRKLRMTQRGCVLTSTQTRG